MIEATFNSQTVFVLPYRPDAARGASAQFAMQTYGSRSQDGREAHASMRYTLITAYRCSLQLHGADVAAFNRGLKIVQNRKILCPFWPAAQLASSSETHWASSGIWMTIEKSGVFEIHTSSGPSGFTPSASALKVPVMVGIFQKKPKAVLGNPVSASVPIQFIESGPADYALRPKSVTAANGPALASRTPKVFPLVADWRESPTFETSEEIDRWEAGYTRTPAEEFHPQTSERRLEMSVTALSGDESAQLLGFFHARQGDVESFWVEGAGEETKLTADTSSGSAVINVRATTDLGDTRFLAFVRMRQASILREVISINAGANQLTLNSSPGTLGKDSVRVTALVLARFSSPKISFDFIAGGKAEVRISVREATQEYTIPAGETYGVTIGALPRVAELYRFRQKFPSGDVVTRYTSHERDVDAAGEIFTKLDGIDHGTIIDSLEIEKTSVKMEARIPEGSVLARLSPYTLEGKLQVEILETVVDAAGNGGAPVMQFIGTVKNPKRDGTHIEFNVVHLLQELQADVPTMMVRGVDNNTLYSPESGIDEADWTFTAAVISLSASGSSITLGSFARTLGVPTLEAEYFRSGRVWKGSGSSLQSRTIVSSTAVVGGQVTIRLNSPFEGAVSGSLSLSPGYNGDPEQMRTKFNGYSRVCAFPFVPIGNPELMAVPQEQKTGKK